VSDAVDAVEGHRNLIAYSRATTAWGSGGSFLDEGGILLFAGGSWLPVGSNGAFRTDDGISGESMIARADAFFGQLKRGYSIKVRDTGQDADLQVACETSGIAAFGEPVPEMICRNRLDEPQLPDGVALRPVVDEEGVRDFVAVNADAYAVYGLPADVMPDFFSKPDAVLADPDVAMVVAYRDEHALAAALTYVSEGTASLQWVGTVAQARQMQLGRAVTLWATNTAFDMGARSCTLQASPMGEPLYAKLGYETLFHYREHVRWRVPRA
jgi:hypothetical protein